MLQEKHTTSQGRVVIKVNVVFCYCLECHMYVNRYLHYVYVHVCVHGEVVPWQMAVC